MNRVFKPTLVREIERPPKAVVEGLAALPAANIADALGKPCRFTVDPSIRPAYPGVRLAGVAVTVREAPDCNLMSHAAIDLMAGGDVLVVDAGGYVGSAVGGFLMSRKMMSKGVAGVVVDGAWRDRSEIVSHRFPVFCRGWQPGGPHKDQPGSVNVPVSVGGVVVYPGDVVVGDDDGVVVVPRDSAEEILRRATEIHRREAEVIGDDRKEAIERPGAYASEERLRELGVEIR
ncbi:dimethylmenaquinone methyltransferase [Candidatus Bathyarchaeota archaeon]|nr:dimethylmenaquinone methyltransferase [Candidatus Bathyarchaeota archaeon]